MREAKVTIRDEEFSEMGIEELVSLVKEAGIEQIEELVCDGDSSVMQFDLESRLDEERLADLAYVTQWEHVTESGGTHIYIVAFTAPALSDEVAQQADGLVGVCEPEVDEEGVRMSLSGPQEVIAGTLEGYEQEGLRPELRKLGPYEASHHPLDELTDRQREVVETAFQLGYYEVPRAVSADRIARELDLDPSTVTEHLQRAERNLMSALLSAE